MVIVNVFRSGESVIRCVSVVLPLILSVISQKYWPFTWCPEDADPGNEFGALDWIILPVEFHLPRGMFRRKQECEAVSLVRLNLKFVD